MIHKVNDIILLRTAASTSRRFRSISAVHYQLHLFCPGSPRRLPLILPLPLRFLHAAREGLLASLELNELALIAHKYVSRHVVDMSIYGVQSLQLVRRQIALDEHVDSWLR